LKNHSIASSRIVFETILCLVCSACILMAQDQPDEIEEEPGMDETMFPEAREPGSFGNNDLRRDFNTDGVEDFFRAVLYDQGWDEKRPIKAVIKYYKSENGREPRLVKTFGTYYIPFGIGMNFITADLNKDGLKDVIFKQFIPEHPDREKWYAIYMQKPNGDFEHAPFSKK
jgi:hypothetical protein